MGLSFTSLVPICTVGRKVTRTPGNDIIQLDTELKHNMDFRAVYATALKKWLGISSESFLGQQPEIDFLA